MQAVLRRDEALLTAPLLAVSGFWVLELSGLAPILPWPWLTALVFGVLPVLVARAVGAGRHTSGQVAAIVAMVGFAFAVQLLLYRDSFILAHLDHLNPLAMAREIAAHGTIRHLPETGDAFWIAYPPGLGLLLAPLFVLFDRLTAIGLYTWIHQAVVALVPLVWAFGLRRLFFPWAPAALTVLAFYVGFLCLDRSLLPGSVHAGKDALMVAALLFPGAMLVLLGEAAGWRRGLVAVLVCLGAVLTHYAMIYLLACIGLAWAAVMRPGWRRLWWCAAVGGAVVALFLPALVQIQAQHMTLADQGQVAEKGRFLVDLLAQRLNPLLHIYNDPQHTRLVPFPWKGAALVLAWLVAMATARWARSKEWAEAPALAGVARAASMLGLAVILAAVLASGLIPGAGVNLIYSSWYMQFPIAALFGCGVAALLILVRRAEFEPRLIASLALLAIVIRGATWLGSDYAESRRHVLKHRVAASDLVALRSVLPTAAPCFLALQGGAIDSGMMPRLVQVAQTARALDHLALLSDCRVVSGSFVAFAMPGGRALDGLPAAGAWPTGAPLTVIAHLEPIERYARALGRKVPELRPLPGGLVAAVF
ncbi:MAG: hypothetical protein FJX46_08430 [Alphaproteobacteria bacterium]|nr:hypothetical protein [Alphaproteobacteria bacterium]